MKVFFDMDNVIADFPNSPVFEANPLAYRWNPPEMYEQFFFENLPPVKGALSYVRSIFNSKSFDCHILTQPVKETHYSYSEKVAWVAKWFPELLGSITLTQNKELLAGHNRILIDDNADKWKDKWEDGGGIFVHFNYNNPDHKSEWKKVYEELIKIHPGDED